MTPVESSLPGCVRRACVLLTLAPALGVGVARSAEPPGAPADASTSAPTPVLRCQLRYAGETRRIEARPVADPYTVVPHEFAGRFRFKAVVVGTGGRVDHVALYVHDLAVPNAPVLVHEVVHDAPFAPGSEIPALTGWNHVYSARLGREFVYGCALAGSGER